MKIVLSAVCVAVLATSAGARICAPRQDVVEFLHTQFNETQVAYGISTVGNRTATVEVFVSEGGSFTIVSTAPTGISCALLAGHDMSFPALKSGVAQ